MNRGNIHMKWKKIIATTATAMLLLSGAVSTKAQITTFTDVSTTDWYYTPIQKLVAFQILNGYEDQTFRPNDYVTRAQAASIIAKALQLDLTNLQNPGFQDVPTTHTHYAAIAALTKVGIFSTAEKFNPNNSLTRAQVAKILVKAFQLNAKNIKKYKDVSNTDWYYQDVGILGTLKITTSKSEFGPNKPVNRAQFASFIERTINYKRGDKTADIWDTWEGWDDVIPPVLSPKELEKKEKQLLQYETSMQQAIKAIKQQQQVAKEATDALEKAYEETYDEKNKKQLEEIQDTYMDALKEFEGAIGDAQATFLKARQSGYVELTNVTNSLEQLIASARKEFKNMSSNLFNWKEKIKDTRDTLQRAIKDGEDAKTMNEIIDSYSELEDIIQEAIAVSEAYSDSVVSSLEYEAKKLEEEIAEAEQVYKEVEKELTERLENRSDKGASYYRNLLAGVEEDLRDAIEAYEKAQKDDDRRAMDNAKEQIEEAIAEAQKVLKRAKVDTLEEEITDLEDWIQEGEDIFEKEKKYNKKQQDYLKYVTKIVNDAAKTLEDAIDDGYREDIEDAQNDLEEAIQDASEDLESSRDKEIQDLAKAEQQLEDSIKKAQQVLTQSYKVKY